MPQYQSLFPGALDTFLAHGSRDGIGLDIDFQLSDQLSPDEVDLITDAILELERAVGIDGQGIHEIWDIDLDTGIQTEEAADEDVLRFDTAGTERMVILANGKIGYGTPTVPHGAIGYAMMALEGLQANANGPHVQFTTAEDDYPTLQVLNWEHDQIALYWDSYFDTAERSSDAGSNFRMGKGLTADTFTIEYDSGIAQGAVITWNDGITLDTSGNVTIPTGTLLVSGVGLIGGDGTAERSRRRSYVTIADGTVANSLNCSVVNRWNGDAIGATDDITKGATVGNFTLNAGGTHLRIEAAGLSGNVIDAIAIVIHNASNTVISTWTEANGNDIEIQLKLIATGVGQDITVLVDTGSIFLDILYITDA